MKSDNKQKYENALQASQQAPAVYHPHDGKIIDTSKLGGIQSYINSKHGLIVPTNFFNGSICRHRGKTYFACRADQAIEGKWWETIRIMACILDDEYNPIVGTEQYLNLHSDKNYHHVEDPRLISDGSNLYCVYTDGDDVYSAVIDDSLCVVKNNGKVNATLSLTSQNQAKEKNWTPFLHKGLLHYVYSEAPRIVLNPNGQLSVPSQSATWEYGHVRGGTPAVPYDGEFITFFHSSMIFDNQNTRWGQRCYFMGALTFNTSQPFSLKRMTSIPLMKGASYGKSIPRPTASLVVFPAGVIEETDHFVVSYGCNDVYTRIIRISKSILNSLLR